MKIPPSVSRETISPVIRLGKSFLRYLRRMLPSRVHYIGGPIDLPPTVMGQGNPMSPSPFYDRQEPYTGFRVPPTYGEFCYQIQGPFINVIHVGTKESCGPETVRMLNLAYLAGQRNSEPAKMVYRTEKYFAGGKA